jgi:hypothetical protein
MAHATHTEAHAGPRGHDAHAHHDPETFRRHLRPGAAG